VGEMLCLGGEREEGEGGGEGEGEARGAGGGAHVRACVRACTRACTRRLTCCPLLPNVNLFDGSVYPNQPCLASPPVRTAWRQSLAQKKGAAHHHLHPRNGGGCAEPQGLPGAPLLLCYMREPKCACSVEPIAR
jgi:hypothetical protein